MAFGHWQIGLHIQQGGVYGIALVREKAQWALRRWWQIPLPADTVVDGQVKHIDALSQALLPWSKTLPRRHRIRLAFPAGRTLQKTFPRPAMRLGERERLSWVAGSLARELDMAGDDLRFDYREDTLQDAYRVTAAQHKDVAELLELAQSLRLHIAAITPDACALQRLIPLLAPPVHWLCWRDPGQWLWATRDRWGRHPAQGIDSPEALAAQVALDPGQGQMCEASAGFDAWCAVPHRQPPLPENGDAWAIAIGLALGEER